MKITLFLLGLAIPFTKAALIQDQASQGLRVQEQDGQQAQKTQEAQEGQASRGYWLWLEQAQSQEGQQGEKAQDGKQAKSVWGSREPK